MLIYWRNFSSCDARLERISKHQLNALFVAFADSNRNGIFRNNNAETAISLGEAFYSTIRSVLPFRVNTLWAWWWRRCPASSSGWRKNDGSGQWFEFRNSVIPCCCGGQVLVPGHLGIFWSHFEYPSMQSTIEIWKLIDSAENRTERRRSILTEGAA